MKLIIDKFDKKYFRVYYVCKNEHNIYFNETLINCQIFEENNIILIKRVNKDWPEIILVSVKDVYELLKNSINLKYCLLNYKDEIVNTFSDLKRYLDIRIKSKIETIELEEIN